MSRDYVPQLATLVTRPPHGEEWWHEIKFDGIRIGCLVHRDRIQLLTRNGKDWTTHFPEVVTAVRALGLTDSLIDGEVAAVLPDGRTSFQALQNGTDRTRGGASLVYFVFDLLRHEGERLGGLPLSERKARLAALLGRRHGRLRLSEHFPGDGAAVLAHACATGLEGIVSKRADRPYYHGRNKDWVKSKCLMRQELVVAGFTEPEGTRVGVGALLTGYYQDGRLVFAGKVGTGFSHKTAVELRRSLDRLVRRTSPFASPPPTRIAKAAHWVDPKLVCEVSFTEWTSDGMIRHPVFQGLRGDKDPRDVRREA